LVGHIDQHAEEPKQPDRSQRAKYQHEFDCPADAARLFMDINDQGQ